MNFGCANSCQELPDAGRSEEVMTGGGSAVGALVICSDPHTLVMRDVSREQTAQGPNKSASSEDGALGRCCQKRSLCAPRSLFDCRRGHNRKGKSISLLSRAIMSCYGFYADLYMRGGKHTVLLQLLDGKEGPDRCKHPCSLPSWSDHFSCNVA